MGNKHIECMLRFMLKSENFYYELTEFLIGERLLLADDIIMLSTPLEKAQFIVCLLNTLSKSEKLMLVDWEWQMLPIEHFRLLLVTDTIQKDFTYGR